MKKSGALWFGVYFLIALATLLWQPAQISAQSNSPKAGDASNASATSLTDAQVQEKISGLLRQMTLEEKVARPSQLPGFPAPEFKENVSQSPEGTLKQLGAGSMLWVSDPKEINRLQHVAVEQSRLHIPVLFGLDVIHGYHTIFPAPIAMASSWDTKMVEESQTVAAREARAAGIHGPLRPWST